MTAGPPLVVVVSGPSGVGKDTLLSRLRECSDAFVRPVTMTTRAPRDGEVHGQHYIFASRDEFERALAAGELLEHAEVYGNWYGVPRSQLRAALAAGRDVVMSVDVQGAATLRELLPGAVFIFLAPASRPQLEAQLRGRGDDPAAIERRLAAADGEFAVSEEFDHVVVNEQGDVDAAVERVLEIVERERARPGREPVVV